MLLVLHKELVSYNPDSQKVKNVGVCGAKDAFHVNTYVESLVLLEEGHEILEEAQYSADEWNLWSTQMSSFLNDLLLILFLICDTCFSFKKYDQLGCDVYT